MKLAQNQVNRVKYIDDYPASHDRTLPKPGNCLIGLHLYPSMKVFAVPLKIFVHEAFV
jgi:hypothetical protein